LRRPGRGFAPRSDWIASPTPDVISLFDPLQPSSTLYDLLRPSTLFDLLRPSSTFFDLLRPSSTFPWLSLPSFSFRDSPSPRCCRWTRASVHNRFGSPGGDRRGIRTARWLCASHAPTDGASHRSLGVVLAHELECHGMKLPRPPVLMASAGVRTIPSRATSSMRGETMLE